MTENLKLLSWVLRGSQRRAIVRVMNRAKIPAEIYEDARKINPKITRNSVSDVLRVFAKERLVICINPEETKGRIYKLTKKGEAIYKYIVDTTS